MAAERALGYLPTDRELEKLGYDIESVVPGTGKLRFLEVKGRVAGADAITVTRNEILTALNKPDDFILAIVADPGAETERVHYVRRPFEGRGITNQFADVSVNCALPDLLARATAPS
jgi:hypothetical protein